VDGKRRRVDAIPTCIARMTAYLMLRPDVRFGLIFDRSSRFCRPVDVRFGPVDSRIDATPFHFKLARRNGIHTKGMQGRGSRQSRG
jgi:hypothetical protein